jgi:hypothetical protein
VSKLLGFHFRIEYKPRTTNVVADTLSWCHTEASTEVFMLSALTFLLFNNLWQEFATEMAMRALLQEVQGGTRGNKWQRIDGLVIIDGWVYVAPNSPHAQAALGSVHDTCHEGIEKTLHCFRVDFHILSAWAAVNDYVRAYLTCQKNKVEHLHPAGLLQPLDAPVLVWVDIVMDFIKGLPCVNGKMVILMVVDHFSKYAHFITLSHPYTATFVAGAFSNDIMMLHGILNSIISDQDPMFTSNFWRELFSSAFDLQSHGHS